MLTLKKSALCPQWVLQRFLWITEEEAIGVFFIITTVCVACTIRTEYVNRIQANFRSKFIPCDIYGGQICCGQILPSRVLQYSPVGIIAPQLHAHLPLTKTNMRSLETFQNQCSFGNQVALERQILSSFFFKNASFVYSTWMINIYQS
jgi:hypothetical protein